MEFENRKIRCHGSIVLEKSLSVTIWATVLIVVNMAEAFSKSESEDVRVTDVLIIVGMLLLIVAVSLFFAIVTWRKTFISLQDDALIYEKRTINRKVQTIGIKNISNINIERNIMERVLKTAKLKIDTNSFSSANATDISFLLKYETAIAFKKYLENKIQEFENENASGEFENSHASNNDGNVASDYANNYGSSTCAEDNHVSQDEDEQEVVFESSDGELVQHCLYELSILRFIVFIATIIVAIEIFVEDMSSVTNGKLGVLGAIIVIAIFVFNFLKTAAGKYFTFYNLTVSRRKNKIYMKYGMFKIKEYAIPVSKINAITIRQSSIERIFKRWNVVMECVGVGDEENETAQLILSLPRKEVMKRLEVLLPEFDTSQLDMITPINKKAIYHKVMKIIFGMTFFLAGVVGAIVAIIYDEALSLKHFYSSIAIVAATVLFISVFAMIMQMKTEAVGIGDTHLMLSTGTFAKKIFIVSYDKIQYFSVKSSPVTNMTKLYSGYVAILAGLLGFINTLPLIEEEKVEMLAEKISR